MKLKNKFPIPLCITSILFFLLLLLPAVASSIKEEVKTQNKKIGILPFKTHTPENLTYLKNGIRDMLASRLSANSGIHVISKERIDSLLSGYDGPVPSSKLSEISNKLKADYLVTGSITALGSSMSLDAIVTDVASPGTPHNFFTTATNENDVIPAINQLAGKISGEIFGTTQPTPEKRIAEPAVETPQPQAHQTAHPDKAFILPSSESVAKGQSPFIRPTGGSGFRGFAKSQNFNMDIQAMDVGDVDGDGNDDVVLADMSEVHVYHRNGNRFSEFGTIKGNPRFKIHGVSLADLNNNGIMEIYVSAADDDSPGSFAAEWQGNDFNSLFTKAPWFIRTLTLPGNRLILAGQRTGINAPTEPGIFSLDPFNALQIGEKVPVPSWLNLFEFSLADLNADGQFEIIYFTQNDRLMVLQANGSMLWTSSDNYGGTIRYIGDWQNMRRTSQNMDEHHPADGMESDDVRLYIPSRIVIADLNDDDLPDVLANKNKPTVTRVLQNLKSYNSGEIYALTWNGIALTDLWHTKKIDGYIVDYQMRFDADNPKKAQLFVAFQLRSGMLSMGKKEGTVLMYSLDFTDEKK